MSRPLDRDELISALVYQMRIQSTVTIFLHQAIAEHLGLNPTDHKCLELLQRQGSMTAGELARESNLTTGAITGVIDRLEKAQFVKRVKDPNDRRRLTIELIPERMESIGGVFQSLGQESIRMFEKYSDDELAIILDFMKEGIKIGTEQTKKLRQQ